MSAHLSFVLSCYLLSKIHELIQRSYEPLSHHPAMHQLLLPVERNKTSSLIFSKMLSQPFHQKNVMSCLVTLMHVWGSGQWMTMNGGTKELSPHGYGELNEAGRDLLSFLSTNEATVCNTWFQKKRIYKQTWQHPKSRK